MYFGTTEKQGNPEVLWWYPKLKKEFEYWIRSYSNYTNRLISKAIDISEIDYIVISHENRKQIKSKDR